MNIKEIKKISEKYEFGNLNNSKGMKTSVEMMYHSTVKIQKYLKILHFIIICLTLTNFATLLGLIYRSVKNPYIPYVIRVDKENSVNGQILNTKNSGNQNVDEKLVEYFLVDFVKKIRTVYRDSEFYKGQTKEKMAFVNNLAKAKIEDFIANKTNTNEVLRMQKSISVEIESFVKIDKDKYQVNFKETTYSQNGTPEKETKYTMVAFLDKVAVNSNAMVRLNPLGLIIKDVEFGNVSQNILQNPIPIQQNNRNSLKFNQNPRTQNIEIEPMENQNSQ